MNSQRERAVSPVVAVILMVAITVILSAVIGTFVLNLSQQNTDGQQVQMGVSIRASNGNVTAKVITGNSDELKLLVNGTEVENITNPSPGDTISTSISGDAKVVVVSITNESSEVVSVQSVTTNSNGPTEPTKGLIAHYTFESISDGVAEDMSGNGNHGNHTNVSSTSGVDGTGGAYNGSDVTELPNIVNGADQFSLSIWVNLNTLSTRQDIFGRQKDWGLLVETDGDAGFPIWGDRALHSGVKTDTWHHIVLVWNETTSGTQYEVWLDGNLSSKSPTDQPNGSAYTLGVGDVEGNHLSGFNGSVDEIRLYNRSLNESEVSRLYNATK